MIAHILAKDLRRFWRETGAFVLVTFAWAMQEAHPSYWIKQHAEAALPMGLFLIWFFLIIRAVHGESLVGDREFWQTRPYVWWHLLLAKVAFLAIALNVPLTVAQIYLLSASGVRWDASWLPGLLWLQLEFAVFLILPTVALAALTETIVQWLLTLVVIGLLIPVVSWLPWGRLQASLSGTEELAASIGIIGIAVALALVILLQYHDRHVWSARLLFAASVASIPIVAVFACSNLGRSLAYPGNRGANPLQFATARTEETRYITADFDSLGTHLQIPVGNVSVEPDTIVLVEGLRISLAGQSGWHWDSSWQNTNLLFTPIEEPGNFSADLPSDIAAKVADGAAASRAELAIAIYRMSRESRIDTGQVRFAVPGNGICAWPFPYRIGGMEIRSLNCVEALRGPDLMTVRVESAESTCAAGEEGYHLPPGHHATSFHWNSGSGPANFDPNPVHKFDLTSGFGTWSPAIRDTTEPNGALQASVCPGTPLHLQIGSFVGRMRIAVDLGAVDKSNLQSDRQLFLKKR